MYYIVDGQGNYYRMNGKNQLVVANGKIDAGVFSFQEATQRISGGKKASFYSIIPVEEWDESEQEDFAIGEEENNTPLLYDMKNVDWKEYLTHFSYLASGISKYQDELRDALSEIDLQICDLVHYVEIYEMDKETSIRVVNLLKECREQRRDIKNEMLYAEWFQKTIGTSNNVAKVKDCLKHISKLDSRAYHPRKLKQLFEHCPEKTVRCSKLIRALEEDTCMNIETAYDEEGNTGNEPEREGVRMEYTKQKTAFDGKENNWLEFAKQQAEFYANIEQYIYNLEDELDGMDGRIEEVLKEIEDASYNVVEGYQVFKELKALRNRRKAKQKELECLYILTDRVDCRTMTENLEACVDEIEAVVSVTEKPRECSQAIAG